MNYKEVFLEAASVMWGYAKFIHLLFPEEWKVGVSGIPPEINARQTIEGTNWVLSGYINVGVLPDVGRPRERMYLRVKIDNAVTEPRLKEWLRQNCERIKRSGSKKMDEAGYINVGNHKGAYVIWTVKKRRFGFFGETIREAKLVSVFHCDLTSRKIKLEFFTSHPTLLLDNKKEIFNVISSIGCHGHAKKNIVILDNDSG
ncbi:MAG: hypothetical protein ACE5HG_00330 [Candidatus Bathyarchaeia archaeon]